MASGLQCPGCGHVHPAGLPEIARGDAVFRCYGCYRPLSIPEGWTGRPAPRPEPDLPPVDGAPPGAGTRDARAARLAARRGVTLTRSGAGSPAEMATRMSPVATAGGHAPGAAPTTTGPGAGRPRGWVAPRRAGRTVPASIRALVWAVAFGVGLAVTAFVLRKVGLLDIDTVIDVYAGSGAGRFAILLALLPLWAVVSATIAHFSLEALARRRQG